MRPEQRRPAELAHCVRPGQRTERQPCESSVESYVLTEAGHAACGRANADGQEIVAEGKVLDRGPGLDVASLTRRGDQLVWLHDGKERTAPLP